MGWACLPYDTPSMLFWVSPAPSCYDAPCSVAIHLLHPLPRPPAILELGTAFEHPGTRPGASYNVCESGHVETTPCHTLDGRVTLAHSLGVTGDVSEHWGESRQVVSRRVGAWTETSSQAFQIKCTGREGAEEAVWGA